MSLCHHPDYSSLVSYAAGSLPESLGMVVACHLSVCEQCQQTVAEAEQLGSQLLENITPASIDLSARNDILSLLEEDFPEVSEMVAADQEKEVAGDVPRPLQAVLGSYLDGLHWKTMTPGIKQFILPASGSNLRLLKIAPGTCMPVHGHTGSELTMVLKGSYNDELGRFCAGDIADLDPDVQHQPVADTSEGCICLIATDAPLRFVDIVPRLLQPFFRL